MQILKHHWNQSLLNQPHRNRNMVARTYFPNYCLKSLLYVNFLSQLLSKVLVGYGWKYVADVLESLLHEKGFALWVLVCVPFFRIWSLICSRFALMAIIYMLQTKYL